jgi:zinc transporter ZupT
LIGGLIGLSIGTIHNSSLISAFVAGNFIYIATVDMMPEAVHNKNIGETVIQITTIALGFLCMFGILALEGE